jgi:hypothetical protein
MRLDVLVGQSLESFTVKQMIEVYVTKQDGSGRTHAVACFEQPHVAEAFAEWREGGLAFNKTREVLVITNGTVAFRVDYPESVIVLNDEEEAVKLREIAINKLSPAIRKLLGF